MWRGSFIQNQCIHFGEERIFRNCELIEETQVQVSAEPGDGPQGDGSELKLCWSVALTDADVLGPRRTCVIAAGEEGVMVAADDDDGEFCIVQLGSDEAASIRCDVFVLPEIAANRNKIYVVLTCRSEASTEGCTELMAAPTAHVWRQADQWPVKMEIGKMENSQWGHQNP